MLQHDPRVPKPPPLNTTYSPYERETHASKHDVALGRLSLEQRRIIVGPDYSFDADRREQGDFGGVAHEGGDLRERGSTVPEKTLEDGAADVT